MQELRFVAVSEDGSYAVLAVPGRSGRYILPIDERLRAVAHGQTSRLAQYEIEVESPLRPKEIQARIRAGETAEEIADAAGIPVERVRWFEGPVLAERAYIADQAQAASVRRAGDAGPGPRLGDIVGDRLLAGGTDAGDGQWDSRKRGDGNWQVSLQFPSAGRLHVAEWVFDPRRRHVMPDDDNAARLSLPESDLPAESVAVPMPGEATVTPIASRLGAVAGMSGGGGGGGFGAAPGVSRFRPERSVIPDRSLGADRSLVDRPVAQPAPERPVAAERPAAAPPAPALPRSGYQDQPAAFEYAEFPESAPYRAPASVPPPAAQPSAYRAPAQEPAPYRPPVADPPAQTVAYQPPPAFRAPEPAPVTPAPPAQVPTAPAMTDSAQEWPTQPRSVYFDNPEPAGRGEDRDRALKSGPEATPEPVVAETPAPVETPAERPAAVAESAATVVPPQEDLAPQPDPQPVTGSAAAEPEVTVAAVAPAVPAEPAPTAPVAVQAKPVVVEPEAAQSAAEPKAPVAPAAEPKAPDAESASAEPAESAPAEEQTSRQRSGAKKNPKGRRSSVPSWDEIMLGSSRQRD